VVDGEDVAEGEAWKEDREKEREFFERKTVVWCGSEF
jgi:hypothetical protein